MILAATNVTFAQSAFVPIAIGFFGLGTGYLIYGPQELFGFPKRTASVNLGTGVWGLAMPGFMQFLAAVYIWVGLAWFGSFRTTVLYTTAVAFTAFGVHWFALGYNRLRSTDPTPTAFMAIAFILLSILGIISFLDAHDAPVAGLFIGLTGVYVSEIFASLKAELGRLGEVGERSLGFFHLGTGLWLIYLTFAAVLNTSNGFHLWL
jgi:hypothetical protein